MMVNDIESKKEELNRVLRSIKSGNIVGHPLWPPLFSPPSRFTSLIRFQQPLPLLCSYISIHTREASNKQPKEIQRYLGKIYL